MTEKRQKSDTSEYQRGREDAINDVLTMLHSERDHNVIRKAVEEMRNERKG